MASLLFAQSAKLQPNFELFRPGLEEVIQSSLNVALVLPQPLKHSVPTLKPFRKIENLTKEELVESDHSGLQVLED